MSDPHDAAQPQKAPSADEGKSVCSVCYFAQCQCSPKDQVLASVPEFEYRADCPCEACRKYGEKRNTR